MYYVPSSKALFVVELLCIEGPLSFEVENGKESGVAWQITWEEKVSESW